VAAHRFWRVLVQVDRIFKHFRSGFLGKASPVHFFSGRTAPLHPSGVPGLPDAVTREAYSHEVSSAGFWPGNEAFPRAAFYSYAYPEPAGFRDWPVTAGARFDKSLGEFILPSYPPPMRPQPRLAPGTAPRWSALSVCLRAREWPPALDPASPP
jgi:Family of unknown function (DUF5996)